MKPFVRYLFYPLLFILLTAVTLPAAGGDSLSRLVADQIEEMLSRDPLGKLMVARESLHLRKEVARFYAQRDHAPAWLEGARPSSPAKSLQRALHAAKNDGLSSQDYSLPTINELMEQVEQHGYHGILFNPATAAQLDLLLSHAFMLHAARLNAGQVDPNTLFAGEWKALPPRADVVGMLNEALRREDIEAALQDLSPSLAGYLALREVLQHYRLMEELGGWPKVSEGPVLRRGDVDARVPQLRKRLWLEGDFDALGAEEDELYDGDTVAAVRRFQRRHGLSPDGAVGPKTLAELNRSAGERVRQIELNLERWRWLPRNLGARHILVNIADFSMQVIEQGRVVMHMPVVVGTAVRRTPVFSDRMTYLEFAPYWGVPPTILEKDKLPRIRADRRYLDDNHFEIIPWRGPSRDPMHPDQIDWQRTRANTFPGLLRQRPGPWNPLGQVKFMFPNEFDIYLHDTPDRHLFSQNRRTFSSGCIRIERAADLAQYLLEDNPDWDCDRLYRALNASEPRRVMLRRPIDVHLLYFTAWVDKQGVVQFRADPYERDAVLALALENPLKYKLHTARSADKANGASNN